MVVYSDWMGALADDLNISRMGIPGSHVSAACFKLASPSARCQNVGIYEQLNNGVRFLDFRVSKDYMNRGSQVDNLIMVNGKLPIKFYGSYKLKDCLMEIYCFLDSHPRETVLLSIKQEGAMLNWDHENDEFSTVLFQRYIGKNRNKWHISSQIPNLGNCRGKITLIRRFPVKENGIYKNFGIPSILDHHDGIYENRICCLQDVKLIKTQDELKSKVELIKMMIDKSNEHHSTNADPKLFINFCSCSNSISKQWWPSNADKKLREFNIHDLFYGLSGIIVSDFVHRDNWKLVHSLIKSNFN